MIYDHSKHEGVIHDYEKDEHTKLIRGWNEEPRPRCLHEACPRCKGTGIEKDGTRCVHMISCSCPKCSPRM